MTTPSHPQFQEPQPTATPRERRKFVVLVSLGFVVVLLIWIWTLPFNFRKPEEGPAGPRQFFNMLGDQVSTTLRAYQGAGTTDAASATDAATRTDTDTTVLPSTPTTE